MKTKIASDWDTKDTKEWLGLIGMDKKNITYLIDKKNLTGSYLLNMRSSSKDIFNFRTKFENQLLTFGQAMKLFIYLQKLITSHNEYQEGQLQCQRLRDIKKNKNKKSSSGFLSGFFAKSAESVASVTQDVNLDGLTIIIASSKTIEEAINIVHNLLKRYLNQNNIKLLENDVNEVEGKIKDVLFSEDIDGEIFMNLLSVKEWEALFTGITLKNIKQEEFFKFLVDFIGKVPAYAEQYSV